MKRSLSWGIGFLVVALLAIPTLPATAANTQYRWVGEGDGTTWGSETNWSPNGVPANDDIVVIERTPGGPSHVTGVTSTQLQELTLGDGASIDGAALTTDTFTWTGGIVYLDLTVNDLMTVQGDDQKELNDSKVGGGTLSVIGDATLTGSGRLFSSGTIFNHGAIDAVPIEGTEFLLLGGDLDNFGQVKATSPMTLKIENTDIDNRPTGMLGPGHLELTAATLRMRPSSDLAGAIDLQNLTSFTADGAAVLRPGTDLSQFPGTTLTGTTPTAVPEFKVSSGSATFNWLGGQWDQGPIFRDGVGLEIAGASLKTLSNAGKAPLRIDPGVQVTQGGSGALRLTGPSVIDNDGEWVVPLPGEVRIEGGACCANPSQFRNRGIVRVFPPSTLAVANARFFNLVGTISGVQGQQPGTLDLEGGSNVLGNGTEVRNTEVSFTANGNFELRGKVTLSQGSKLTQTEQSDMKGTATVNGDGRYSWLGGTIYGRPTFEAGVTLDIRPAAVQPDPHALNGFFHGGVIVAEGDTRLDDDVAVVSVGTDLAGFDNRGIMSWVGGDITGIASTGFFANRAVLTVNPGQSQTVTLSGLATRNTGTLTTKSGTFHLTDDLLQTAGLTRLAGGELQPDAPFRLRGGELRGPGKVDGDIVNTGGIVGTGPGVVGRIAVGDYAQGSGGRLKLKVKNTASPSGFDRLVASGPLSLNGTLILARLGTTALSPGTVVIVSGASRTGTFAGVAGLSTLGAGWHVRYGPANVRLQK